MNVATILLSKHIKHGFYVTINIQSKDLHWCVWISVLWIVRKSVNKDSLFPFSQKCWCQHFFQDSRLIISKNDWLPPLFFLDSNSPCKDLPFLHGSNLDQQPLNLVDTVEVLKTDLRNASRIFGKQYCQIWHQDNILYWMYYITYSRHLTLW